MTLIVRGSGLDPHTDDWPASVHQSGRPDEFDAAASAEADEGDGAPAPLSTESDYPPTAEEAAPQSEDADEPSEAEDIEIELPAWDPEAGRQRIGEILPADRRWEDLSQDEQDEIRGLLVTDILDSARGNALDEETLGSGMSDRRQTLLDALPSAEGLEEIVNEVHDDIRGQVDDTMTPAMRDAIEKGLANPDDEAAWSDFRIEATRQIDDAVLIEAGSEPDPETGRQPRSEEQVVGDYTGLLLELTPENGGRESLTEQLEGVAQRILVERPSTAIREGEGGFLAGLDRQTEVDRTGQPMSAMRVSEIIEANEGELETALSGLTSSGGRREAADHLNAVATRANAEPGGEEGLKLLAATLVDEGLMDSPLESSGTGSTFYEDVMASVEDGYGIDLSLQVAAEFARRGNTDRAEIIMQEARSRSRAFFGSVGDTAEEFRTVFRDEPQQLNASLRGILSPEEEAGGVENLQRKLREENGELYDRFQHNRDGIISTLSALEHLPEELQDLDGAERFASFHDDTMEVLGSNECLADEDAYDYQKGLQAAVFESEFNVTDISPVSTATRQRLTELPDSYYSEVIQAFDHLQDTQSREGGEDAIPITPELTELREALGEDVDTAAGELKTNPEAAFALSQFLYLNMAQSEAIAGGVGSDQVPSEPNVDFLARTTRNLIGNIVETESPYLKSVFSKGAGTMQPRFPAPDANRQAAMANISQLESQSVGRFFRHGITRLDEVTGLINVTQGRGRSARIVQGSNELRLAPMEGLAGLRWVGPGWVGGNAALNAWGAHNFFPREIFNDDPITTDTAINGAWTAYFLAVTGQQGYQAAAGLRFDMATAAGRTPPAYTNFARAPGVKTLMFNAAVNRIMPPLMIATVANEVYKGDWAMAAAWTPGLAASFMPLMPALASTSWAGPVALGLWVVSAAAAVGIFQYRRVEAANQFEDPMKWYFEGAGYSAERAHEMGNATGDGEIRYPLLAAASETYLGIDPQRLGDALADDGMPDDDLGALVELTHYLEVELDNEGRLPSASEVSESDRYLLSAIYRFLPDEYKNGSPPMFADGSLPELWEGTTPWEGNEVLSHIDLENVLPWEDAQLPDGAPWNNDMYRQQPERVKEIISQLYWR